MADRSEWWWGFNDAACGSGYDSPTELRTSTYEYQRGYLTGCATKAIRPDAALPGPFEQYAAEAPAKSS